MHPPNAGFGTIGLPHLLMVIVLAITLYGLSRLK